MSGSENRVHARIHVSTKVEVATPAGMVEAELRDLSKGGACFQIAHPVGGLGETVELLLPSLDKSEIAVRGQIIRVTPLPSGMKEYGVRFDAVEPSMRQQLLDLIEVLLSASGGGRRSHPRVARRIEVRFGQLLDLKGILEDISKGGLMMTVNEPLVLYEEVDVTVPDLAGAELLILHARVVNQLEVKRETGVVWHVNLEFTQMRLEAKRCVDALLRVVIDAAQ
jgi:Tfp pilus assembly protein PilZ